MKQLLGSDFGSYSFNAASKQITFGGLPNNEYIGIQQVLLITNVTSTPPVIIFNFASSGGTMSNNVLTLTYNTTSMSNSDQLQIYIDTEMVNETLHALLRRMNKLLESNAVVDSNLRQRISIDAIGTNDLKAVASGMPITAASGTIASGAVASSAIASGAVASGAFASGSIAAGAIVAGNGPMGVANANYPTPATPLTISSQNVQYIGEGPVDQRWRVLEEAHIAYATAIRSQLSW